MNNNKIARQIFLCFLLAVVSGLVTFGRDRGQTIYAEQSLAPMPSTTLVELRADTLPNAPKFQRDSTLRRAPQTATFNINYNPGSCVYPVTAWPNDAMVAFESAIGIWGAILESSQTIEVDACWVVLHPNILGSAGALAYDINFPNAPIANTWYPIAVANGIAGEDLAPGLSDIVANFNSSYPNWYFGTDGNPANNEYDFTTVILHEVGHGLGFSGSMRVEDESDTTVEWGGGTGLPVSFDRFAENGSNQSLINTALFPNNSAALTSQLTSGNIFFDGPEASAANGNSPVELYAPGSWNQGSSYSHLGESYNGTNEALMTYSLSLGEVQHNPGPIIRALLNDAGWNATLSLATATPTATVIPTDIPTNTPTATETPIPTATETPTNTVTPIPSNTPVPSPSMTAVHTVTPVPSNTPTEAPSETPVGTATHTPTPNPTLIITATQTSTPIVSMTSMPTLTATVANLTPTISPSMTHTAVPTLTPELTQTVTPSSTPASELTILFYLPITTR